MKRALPLAVVLVVATSAAAAAPLTYQCPDKLSFTANFTPERVHVNLKDVQMVLARVPAAGQAVYVDRRRGLSLTTLKREAVLKIGSSELRCEFFVKP